MQIDVLLPTGTRTVDLEELKELVRQGVVQQSTLLETGGQRGKAKNVPALKPIFAELAAAPTQAPEPPSFPPIPTPPESPRTVESPNVPSIPTPPEPPVVKSPQTQKPPVFSPISPPEPPSENSDFVAVLREIGKRQSSQPLADAPSSNENNELYEISIDDETTRTSTSSSEPTFQIPIPPSASPSSNDGAYYFEAKTPVPFVPKRFRSSKKGFYVDSLKALRSAELAHWVAWGRGFLRVFDVLFVVATVIYLLVLTVNAGKVQYNRAEARQEENRFKIYQRLNDALENLGTSDAPFSRLEETQYAWIERLLTQEQKIEFELKEYNFLTERTEYNFRSKNFAEQFEILEIAEKQSVELEKKFPKKLSQQQKELQSFFKEFRQDVKQARKLKKEYDNIPFPILRFLGGTLLALIGASLVVALAAFVYGLATILFRILLSAADLYAASFRDDFDPAANKRRDDLLASVETIKVNGVPANPDANDAR